MLFGDVRLVLRHDKKSAPLKRHHVIYFIYTFVNAQVAFQRAVSHSSTELSVLIAQDADAYRQTQSAFYTVIYCKPHTANQRRKAELSKRGQTDK